MSRWDKYKRNRTHHEDKIRRLQQVKVGGEKTRSRRESAGAQKKKK